MQTIALITPAISSFNLGDEIVDFFISKIIADMFPKAFAIKIPAYNMVDSRATEIISKSDLIFLCGTGLFQNELSLHWKISESDYKNNVVAFGIGWNKYQPYGQISNRTQNLLSTSLSMDYAHSMRDSYSTVMFRQISNQKALNTCCPTFWNLTWDRINRIKSKHVMFTLLNLPNNKNKEHDAKLLGVLSEQYEKLYFYPQCPVDYQYAKQFGIKFECVTPNLNTLSKFYKEADVDYVGYRLHGAAFALSHNVRTIILSADNRATEIGRDINLPVIQCGDFAGLGDFINGAVDYDVNLPHKAINDWMEQFK